MKGPTTLPAFSLTGTDNQLHEVPGKQGRTATVIIFTCNHCPYAQAYVSRIANIVQEFQHQGVDFFAINPNDASQYPQDDFEHMPEMAEAMALNGFYLHDPDQKIAGQFSAERTPEVFVYDRDDTLVYHGAIDDHWQDPDHVKHHYLQDALNALLSNKSVPVDSSQPAGCTIKWKK